MDYDYDYDGVLHDPDCSGWVPCECAHCESEGLLPYDREKCRY